MTSVNSRNVSERENNDMNVSLPIDVECKPLLHIQETRMEVKAQFFSRRSRYSFTLKELFYGNASHLIAIRFSRLAKY